MSNQLHGRVAVVTGAASGLGRAFAEALAAEGAYVVIDDINKAGGKATERRTLSAGGAAVFHRADISKSEEALGLIDTSFALHGRIDILINNAGVQHISPISEFSEEKWHQLIGVMLTGPFLTTKYAFPHMIAQKRGRIINISSTQGLVASEFKAAYVAAKHGVLGLTKVTALEGARHNITAVSVCPSYVRTPLAEMQIAGQAKYHGISEEEVAERIMLGPAALKHLLEPSEVAALVVYLCSDAAHAITGTAVAIDCGWTAR
ncbi:MAG: 3-hydroxybutyrate dehydrogenase [Terriglobia bacterium]|jgi:3-hydroxybutyrate dehydrogenase